MISKTGDKILEDKTCEKSIQCREREKEEGSTSRFAGSTKQHSCEPWHTSKRQHNFIPSTLFLILRDVIQYLGVMTKHRECT